MRWPSWMWTVVGLMLVLGPMAMRRQVAWAQKAYSQQEHQHASPHGGQMVTAGKYHFEVLIKDHKAVQVYLYDNWPSGLYGSPVVAGARPAAPIATAWAVMTYLGVDGYVDIMRSLLGTVAKVRAAIDSIEPITVVGDPIGPVLAMRSDEIDLYAVGDVMDDRGWNLNRNTQPPGLHLMLSPAHASVVDELLADLRAAVDHHGTSRGVGARYA